MTGSVNDGAVNNAKAVVSTQGGDTGKGGTNTLGSHTGTITVGTNARVLADFTGLPGQNGTNVLAGCAGAGVVRNGIVSPLDSVGDDKSCPAVTPLFTDCSQFGITF